MTIQDEINSFIPLTHFVPSTRVEVKGKVSYEADGHVDTEDGGIRYCTAVYAVSKKRAKQKVIVFTNADIAGLHS
jgi:hypothetical protein